MGYVVLEHIIIPTFSLTYHTHYTHFTLTPTHTGTTASNEKGSPPHTATKDWSPTGRMAAGGQHCHGNYQKKVTTALLLYRGGVFVIVSSGYCYLWSLTVCK